MQKPQLEKKFSKKLSLKSKVNYFLSTNHASVFIIVAWGFSHSYPLKSRYTGSSKQQIDTERTDTKVWDCLHKKPCIPQEL
jgi:hypothetical protein